MQVAADQQHRVHAVERHHVGHPPDAHPAGRRGEDRLKLAQRASGCFSDRQAVLAAEGEAPAEVREDRHIRAGQPAQQPEDHPMRHARVWMRHEAAQQGRMEQDRQAQLWVIGQRLHPE